MPLHSKAGASRHMQFLPPLDALRFFEAAARHESFTAAGRELGVTSAAVAHRVRTLEASLNGELFVRHPRGVRLSRQGMAYMEDVRRILGDLHDATKRQRNRGQVPVLKILSVDIVAQMWLIPRLARFKAIHPDLVIELEVDHRGVDPDRRDFDAWISLATRVEHALHTETLFEDTLAPVCSPAFLEARERPRRPIDLLEWPLLYSFEWRSHWAHWCAHHDAPPPDLNQASGFRLYSMTIQAAVHGMGVALGHSSMIARELECESLTTILEKQVMVPAKYFLIVTSAARNRPEVRAFRDWILGETSTMQATSTGSM